MCQSEIYKTTPWGMIIFQTLVGMGKENANIKIKNIPNLKGLR